MACCKNCGGELVGLGYTSPVRCLNANVPDGAEPDSGPWYCEPDSNNNIGSMVANHESQKSEKTK